MRPNSPLLEGNPYARYATNVKLRQWQPGDELLRGGTSASAHPCQSGGPCQCGGKCGGPKAAAAEAPSVAAFKSDAVRRAEALRGLRENPQLARLMAGGSADTRVGAKPTTQASSPTAPSTSRAVGRSSSTRGANSGSSATARKTLPTGRDLANLLAARPDLWGLVSRLGMQPHDAISRLALATPREVAAAAASQRNYGFGKEKSFRIFNNSACAPWDLTDQCMAAAVLMLILLVALGVPLQTAFAAAAAALADPECCKSKPPPPPPCKVKCPLGTFCVAGKCMNNKDICSGHCGDVTVTQLNDDGTPEELSFSCPECESPMACVNGLCVCPAGGSGGCSGPCGFVCPLGQQCDPASGACVEKIDPAGECCCTGFNKQTGLFFCTDANEDACKLAGGSFHANVPGCKPGG